MKKYILTLGTASAIIMPVATIVSCGLNNEQTDTSPTKVNLKTKDDLENYFHNLNITRGNKQATISLPKGEDKIDFTNLFANLWDRTEFSRGIFKVSLEFKDMDMTNIHLDNIKNTPRFKDIGELTLNHVTGLQSATNWISDKVENKLTFTNIDEDLDFSDIDVSKAAFKDMDMSHLKIKDGDKSFDQAHFINVTNLNLIGKKFDGATFENVNGAIGNDCSKIPGHNQYTGKVNKYFDNKILSSASYAESYMKYVGSLAGTTISLPQKEIPVFNDYFSDKHIDFSNVTFKDMDMTNLTLNHYVSNTNENTPTRNFNSTIFNHVTGLSHFLKQNDSCQIDNAIFINIDEDLDFSDIDVSKATFKDMDMSHVTCDFENKNYNKFFDMFSFLKNAIFNHVTGLQDLIDCLINYKNVWNKNYVGTEYNDRFIHDAATINGFNSATFININEDLDFSKIIISSATFKDMDMSHLLTKDAHVQGDTFTNSNFINVTNLNLIGKNFNNATFENVNGAKDDDCSKIPGHPNFVGDINKYYKTLTSLEEFKKYVNSGKSLSRAIISLNDNENNIDFGNEQEYKNLDFTYATFKDMDMSNIKGMAPYAYKTNLRFSNIILDNVTGLQNFIKTNVIDPIFQGNPFAANQNIVLDYSVMGQMGDVFRVRQALQSATFINIDEDLDFSDIDVSKATFKDMDMSHIKTWDCDVNSFSGAHFINVTNLNLIGKIFDDATFENVNGATGHDYSKIPGTSSYKGDISKYYTTLTSVDAIKIIYLQANHFPEQ